MKEYHIFYEPNITDGVSVLSPEETTHALRVLRMKAGDALTLTDGKGAFYEGYLTAASFRCCSFFIEREWKDTRQWQGSIHLAVAPTKNIDRIEWLVEKATEIGIDSLTLLKCANSERKVVKRERLEKIAISAMKQSHKAYKPIITEMIDFKQFVNLPFDGQRFIAHCYNSEVEGSDKEIAQLSSSTDKFFLGDMLHAADASLVLIGPEGDFSPQEVNQAMSIGFSPVSLGESRLRTETAALVAVHLMYLAKRNNKYGASHD